MKYKPTAREKVIEIALIPFAICFAGLAIFINFLTRDNDNKFNLRHAGGTEKKGN